MYVHSIVLRRENIQMLCQHEKYFTLIANKSLSAKRLDVDVKIIIIIIIERVIVVVLKGIFLKTNKDSLLSVKDSCCEIGEKFIFIGH